MFRKIMFAAVMLMTSFSAFAFEIPQSQGKVTDTANVLSVEQKRVLTARLEKIQKERSDHPQIGILTVPSLPEEGIEEFANQTFHSWGIGQKGVDNGLLLVVAPNDRKMRLEVGYGFEPYIPDTTAKKIIDNMKPWLRKKLWYAAFDGAVTDMVGYLPTQTDTATVTPTPVPVKSADHPKAVTEQSSGGHGMLFVILIAGVIIASIYFAVRRSNADFEREQEEEIARRRRELNDYVNSNKTFTSTKSTVSDPQYHYKPVHKSPSSFGSGLVTGAVATEVAESLARRRREDEREEEERRARRRREDEESSSRSSSSWSSSKYSSSDSDSSWGSSSSGSDSSSWGGGDSGGGGASGDW